MDRAAKLVESAQVERVAGDGGDRAKIRIVREELVAKPNMGAVQRACPAAIQALVDVIEVEEVEITHLGAFRADEATEMAGWDFLSRGVAWRDNHCLHEFQSVPKCSIG